MDSLTPPRMQAGDYSLCGYCLKLLRFDGRWHLAVGEPEASELFARSPLFRWLRDQLLSSRAAGIASVTGKSKDTVN